MRLLRFLALLALASAPALAVQPDEVMKEPALVLGAGLAAALFARRRAPRATRR